MSVTICLIFFFFKGGKSIGIPGFLQGLKHAHEKYGVLSWSRLLEPAIRLAK